MATKANITTRRNPIPAAVAIGALGALLIGCQNSAALMDAEAHARKVSAWCRAHDPWRQKDCIGWAWTNVPPSPFWTKHHGHANDAAETRAHMSVAP
jgi:hypothetical protein